LPKIGDHTKWSRCFIVEKKDLRSKRMYRDKYYISQRNMWLAKIIYRQIIHKS